MGFLGDETGILTQYGLSCLFKSVCFALPVENCLSLPVENWFGSQNELCLFQIEPKVYLGPMMKIKMKTTIFVGTATIFNMYQCILVCKEHADTMQCALYLVFQ